MKFVQPLSNHQTVALQDVYKNGRRHRERQRAQALLLSAKGYKLEQLAEIFGCDRDTISQWIDGFHHHGIAGLFDAPKSGRPRKLDAAAQDLVGRAVQQPTPNLKATLLHTLKKKA